VEQVIPLPEASEIQVQISEKTQKKRSARTSLRDTNQYDVTVFELPVIKQAKRNAMHHVIKTLCSRGATPERIAKLIHWKSKSIFFELEGQLKSKEFIQTASKIKEGRFDEGRWFCDDDQLLYSEGKTFALTKMWGERWAEALRILNKEYPEAKIKFEVNQTD